MGFSLKKCPQTEIGHLLKEYVDTLSSPIDSYLEGHILNSHFYCINADTEEAGYIAVHEEQMLTQFYLRLRYVDQAQEVFKRVLQDHSIKSILVPTCDELFLSLVLDQNFEINSQAYFFQDSRKAMPEDQLYQDGTFQSAAPDDAEEIIAVSGDFINRLEHHIEKEQIYTFTKEKALLGIGIIEQSRVLDGYASIGMFTNERYRNRGIGRTIIHFLKEWCKTEGIVPICGCYYYNDASKHTLESAGMVTKTRLISVKVR